MKLQGVSRSFRDVLATPRQIAFLIEVLQDQSEQEPELVAFRAIIDQSAGFSVVVRCPVLQSHCQRDGVSRSLAMQVGFRHVPQLLLYNLTKRLCCDSTAARLSSEGLSYDCGVGYGCGAK